MKISGRGYSIARNDYQWLEWGPSFRVNRQQKIIFCWSIFPECNGFIMGFCYINGLFTGVFSMSLLSLESYVSLDVHVVKMLGSYFQLQLKILAILKWFSPVITISSPSFQDYIPVFSKSPSHPLTIFSAYVYYSYIPMFHVSILIVFVKMPCFAAWSTVSCCWKPQAMVAKFTLKPPFELLKPAFFATKILNLLVPHLNIFIINLSHKGFLRAQTVDAAWCEKWAAAGGS